MSVPTMTTLRNILVPMDFSQHGRGAVNYACDLANDAGSTLHLLHVVNDSLDDAERQKRLIQIGNLIDARSQLAIKTVKEVVRGKPEPTIIDYAQNHGIDLIVMGTHGRTGLSYLTMGSVAEHVVRRAPCPVVMLGPNDGQDATLEDAQGVIAAQIATSGLPVDREEARGQMLKRLVEELRIPSTTAIRLFDQLEEQGWLKWEDGNWSQDSSKVLTNAQVHVVNPTFTSESQAVELIVRARQLRATDIHVDPSGDGESLVRLRIDGRLQRYCRLQQSIADHLCNQLKTMARLDTTDPFHPHEGRVRLSQELSRLEVRLTSAPVCEGQAIALRLFDPEKVFLPLEHLGFTTAGLDQVQRILKSREGLVLVTGPTGSGKTTTVYSMLQSIGGESTNIVSIEDPVEFSAPFVRQISVDSKHGLTMTEGLRTILRMDPDVIFVGEIRSAEAASIGLQAASSGKYVFSTMHTRSVASTISSLRNLGVDEQILVSSLAGIINQRITVRLCSQCKQAVEPNEDQRIRFQQAGIQIPERLFQRNGCRACNGSGVRGRIGIFEIAIIDHEIRKAIAQRISEDEIEELLRSGQSASLNVEALSRAAAGICSFDDAMMIRWIG